MRRRTGIDMRGDPCRHRLSHFDPVGQHRGGRRQSVRGLRCPDVVKPHDVAIAVIDLRSVGSHRSGVVKLSVSVRNAVVILVRFVQMLGRQRCRQGDQRRQHSYDREPAESCEHASRLWFPDRQGVNARPYNRGVVGRLMEFGSHVFDVHTGTLRRGSERCDLQSQPAQLLGLLLDHPGAVVTRDQIRATLWPDTSVAYDQSINFAIRQIRIALGPDANLVQTVPRRGYRFVGDVVRGEARRTGFWRNRTAVAAAVLVAMVSGFGAGVVVRDAPAGQFVYDHLVHLDRCPYVRVLLPILRNS